MKKERPAFKGSEDAPSMSDNFSLSSRPQISTYFSLSSRAPNFATSVCRTRIANFDKLTVCRRRTANLDTLKC